MALYFKDLKVDSNDYNVPCRGFRGRTIGPTGFYGKMYLRVIAREKLGNVGIYCTVKIMQKD